ncbi:hypothetical protein B7494_g1458 [Chlorociboria aeruginascens]|nr:hypothetical protein B7494_g1458 [Chlorociboria aeruginascens]
MPLLYQNAYFHIHYPLTSFKSKWTLEKVDSVYTEPITIGDSTIWSNYENSDRRWKEESGKMEKECFVTVGATADFPDLVAGVLSADMIEALGEEGYTRLTMQVGRSYEYYLNLQKTALQLPSLKITAFAFNKKGLGEEMLSVKAVEGKSHEGVVISHAGAGTILDAMRLGLPIIVVANPALLDNHQEELATELAAQGYCHKSDVKGLKEAIRQVGREQNTKKWGDTAKVSVSRPLDKMVGYEEEVKVLAAPAPQMSYGENTGPVGGVTPPIPTVSTTSGSLYGPSSLLGEIAAPSPVSGGDSAFVTDFPLVNGQEADLDLGLYLDFNSVENPQPIRGTGGQTEPGARTYDYEKLNPDIYAPPGTDSGSVPQAQWPMGLSHNRFGTGLRSGFARQQTVDQLPAAVEFAGVDMRLAPHAYRELHWHTANEWSIIMKGSVRVSAINEDGESFIDDISAGDVWFFPAGVPHSIQALDEGAEFLLVFDQGTFNEDSTVINPLLYFGSLILLKDGTDPLKFLVSEMFLRNPKSVLSKDLQTPVSAFDNLPTGQLYIFEGTPASPNIQDQQIIGPNGILPVNDSYTYHFSQQEPYVVPGGQVKIIDSTTFPIATNFAAALVTIEPGAMREIHWHLTSDEWNFFLQGSARITIFAAPEASQTFDYTAGDVGYIPASNSHYIENTGTEDVIVLEMLKQPKFTDISVAQWLALTPRQIVLDTLHLPNDTLNNLPQEKQYIKQGNLNLTALAADPNGTAAYEG